MSFVPSTAAQNTATLAGSNQASLASPLTALQDSITNGNLAPAALIDAILSSTGYQGQDVSTSSATISSASFVNIWGQWTFNAKVAKTYLLHLDVCLSAATLVGGRALAQLSLVVNGSTVPFLTNSPVIDMISTVNYWNGSWRGPIALNAGNNTIQLQGAAVVGTFSLGGNGQRTFTITG